MTCRNVFFSIAAILMLYTTSHADVMLRDTQGISTSFSSLKGKWVVINYWASWCPTCMDEIPEFNRFFQKHQHDKVALFGVNYDALPLTQQNKLIKQFKIAYPSLLSDPSEQLELGDIRAIPATFIFNPQGKLVAKLFGGQSAESLDKAIEKNKN